MAERLSLVGKRNVEYSQKSARVDGEVVHYGRLKIDEEYRSQYAVNI